MLKLILITEKIMLKKISVEALTLKFVTNVRAHDRYYKTLVNHRWEDACINNNSIHKR